MEQQDIARELARIKARNRHVEAEKAWETSAARKLLISFVTFIIAGFALAAIGNDHPWRNALIPTLGYLLSTQSLPFAKKRWIARYEERHERN